MARRSIRKAVEDALKGRPDDWKSTLARKLAATLDQEPNASMARELRALMASIEEAGGSTGGTPLDELRQRRAERGARAAV